MNAKSFLFSVIFSLIAFVCMGESIKLPEPRLDENASLKNALENRCSQRDFKPGLQLDLQTMSNLLWAGWGYNRDEKRTAPSALNRQEVTLYVCTKEGVFYYDANEHALVKVLSKNISKATGKQDFVEKAPVNLLYVCDMNESAGMEMTAVCCGAISQNISLYCASVGLATVVRGSFDVEQLRRLLNLQSKQKVMLAQSVGFSLSQVDE